MPNISLSPHTTEKTKPHAHYTHKTPRLLPKPYTAQWVINRLQDSPKHTLAILKTWSHNRRYREMNDQTINQIRALEPDQAVKALEELKKPHVYTRSTHGTTLEMSVKVKTLDTRSEFAAKALVDSGCVGSCIHIDFAERNGINLTPLP